MKNICFLATDFPPDVGGIESHAYELAKALVQIGQNVYVLCPHKDDRLEYELMDGIHVYRVKMMKQKPLYNWQLKAFLKKFIQEHPVDLIHIHGMRPLESAEGLNIPTVFTNHTSGFLQRLEKPKFLQGRLKQRLAYLDLVLAPSYELCDATTKIGYTGPVHFVTNGVDTRKFKPIEQNTIPASKTFLLARRLVDKNGVVVFAKALTLMKNKNYKVLIAGDGVDKGEMERILKEGDCLQHVEFLGFVPNHQMPAIYQKANFSVLPSFYEATSITGLESMACGLPLVGTNVGGIPYLIEQGKSGYLVPSHNAEALAQQLDAVLDLSDDEYRALSQHSRQRAVEIFDWKVVAQETLDLYNSI